MVLKLQLLVVILSALVIANLGSAFAATKKLKSSALIYKGTKWCGHNNIAKSYNDLGKFRRTDMCCRTHDKHCSLRIKFFQKKYGLRNWSIKTASHCVCDIAFKKCLDKVNNRPSDDIYRIYFNILKPRCIRVKIVKKKICLRRRWFHCVKSKVVKVKRAYFVNLDNAIKGV